MTQQRHASGHVAKGFCLNPEVRGHSCVFALLNIASKWNQPRWPSTEEWTMKMWRIYTMKFYSAQNKNEITEFAVK